MMELVHGDQAFVKAFGPEALHREAEGGMGADKNLVFALKERLDGIDLAAVLGAWCVA